MLRYPRVIRASKVSVPPSPHALAAGTPTGRLFFGCATPKSCILLDSSLSTRPASGPSVTFHIFMNYGQLQPRFGLGYALARQLHHLQK